MTTRPGTEPPSVTLLLAPGDRRECSLPGRLHGAPTSRDGRPGNIIPFSRMRGDDNANIPVIAFIADRPAPIAISDRKWWRVPIVLCSMTVHAAFLAAFFREPPAAASIGVEVVSVELVLGTNVAAGLAEMPTQSDAPVNAADSQGEGEDIGKEEAAKALDARQEKAQEPPPEPTPSSEPLAEVTPVPEPQPEPARETQTLSPETAPPEAPAEDAQIPDPVTTSTVAPAEPEPTPTTEAKAPLDPEAPAAREAEPEPAPSPPVAAQEPPPLPAADKTNKPHEPASVQSKPQAAEEPKNNAPKAKPAAKRPQRQTAAKDKAADGKRTVAARTSTASVASSGIGIGRSDASTNYRGLVSAHLARHKRFPDEARRAGESGAATIAFTFDGSGRVMVARLVRGSGSASIDAEAVAMVHRASPFPAPPGGKSMSFTVPVSFHLR